MNYTLNQLQIFLKIVQTGSITKAAEELFLTQPAVSIQLKNFQNQFNLPLTEVLGRKLYVTEFGKEIATAAEAIIEQVQAIDFKTQAFKGQLTGKLKISIVSTGKYVLPFFLTDFLESHKGIELIIDVTNKQKVIQSLENNEVDFALVSILPAKLNIEKLDLLQNQLYLVGKSDLIKKTNTSAKEIFSQFPLIFREEGSGTRQTMEKFLNERKHSYTKKMELTSNEAVKQAILAGLGFSIMPLIGIKNELLTKELQIIPVKGLPIKTTWSLIWLKGKKMRPVSAAYLNFLKTNKKKIIDAKFGWQKDI